MKNLTMNTIKIFFPFAQFPLSGLISVGLQNKIGRSLLMVRKGLCTLPVIPVKVYANADTQKLEILEENKDKSGVYM